MIRFFPLTTVLLASLASVAWGASYTWVGSLSQEWSTPGNWVPFGVPGPGDAATITTGSVAVSAAVTVSELALNGGTVGGGGRLTLADRLDWTAGTVAVDLQLASGLSGRIDSGSNKVISACEVRNAGRVEWRGSGAVYAASGAQWINEAGGTFLIQNDALWAWNGGATGAFVNQGTVRKEGGAGTTQFAGIPFTNSGLTVVAAGLLEADAPLHTSGEIRMEGGSLTAKGGGNWTGPVTVATGHVARLSNGSFSLAHPATVSGEGKLELAGATLQVTGAVGVENLVFSQGTVNGDGELTAVKSLAWTGGRVEADLRLPVGSTTVIDSDSNKTISACEVRNAGRVEWRGSGAVYAASGAQWTNEVGGEFVIQNDALWAWNGGATGAFVNHGTVRKEAGTGTTQFASIPFTNNGLTVAAGRVARLSNGSFSLANPAAVSGEGKLELAGATLQVTGAVSVENLVFSLGTVNGDGELTAVKSLAWTGGRMEADLQLPVGSTTVIDSDSNKTISACEVRNAGRVEWRGSGAVYAASGAQWTNEVGGEFVIQNDALWAWNGGATGAFVNQGTVRKEGGTGTTQFASIPFTNNGLTVVAAGVLEADAPLHTSGEIRMEGGSLTAKGGGNWTGPVTVAAGRVARLSNGTFSLAHPATVSGEGKLELAGATLQVTGAVSVENLVFSQGTVNGDGELTVARSLAWTGGRVEADLRLPVGSTTVIDSASNKTISACEVRNAGRVEWRGSGAVYAASGAQWTNEVGGEFVIQNDALWAWNGGATGAFVNQGTVRKEAGTGTTQFASIPFTNSGVLDIVHGEVRLSGDFAPTESAVLKTHLASATDFGRLKVDGRVTLAGGLMVDLADGYAPAEGTRFAILTGSSVAGTFDSFTSDATGTGVFLNPVYTATGVALPAVGPAGSLPGPVWRTEDGAVHFEVHGIASQRYRVDVSSDLKSWQPQVTFLMPASTVAEYVDPGAAAVPVRYYRVAFVPLP